MNIRLSDDLFILPCRPVYDPGLQSLDCYRIHLLQPCSPQAPLQPSPPPHEDAQPPDHSREKDKLNLRNSTSSWHPICYLLYCLCRFSAVPSWSSLKCFSWKHLDIFFGFEDISPSPHYSTSGRVVASWSCSPELLTLCMHVRVKIKV